MLKDSLVALRKQQPARLSNKIVTRSIRYGSPVYKETDVLTLFQWIKKTLTEEGEIEDIKKEKFNYTTDDYLNTVSSLWTRDSPVFFHGLLKILIVFTL